MSIFIVLVEIVDSYIRLWKCGNSTVDAWEKVEGNDPYAGLGAMDEVDSSLGFVID